jgi:glutamyl-tRNA synthetase
MKVVTRIAPSPTGEMHIGTVRTALYNYLFAKKQGGTYFVRIEDTDKERNKEEWVDAIWRDFEWCGLEPDAKYRTSERLDRHRELLRGLIDSEKAFVSKEAKKDDPSQSVEVVRLRNPGTSVTFADLVRGDVTFDTTELGDFVIARAIDDPLYHFAVVADDGDAGVTHVLRAEEHLSNTPRQILILEALGFERPQYGHFQLILAPDRSKLSKRKHGASIEKYRAQGYLAPALVNYLALLGWNPGTEQELFTLDELISEFDLAHVHKAGAVFDIEKLRWFNRQYLMNVPDAEFASDIVNIMKTELEERGVAWDPEKAQAIIPLIRERISVYEDAHQLVHDGEFDFFFSRPTLDAHAIPERKSTASDARVHIEFALDALGALDAESFTSQAVRDAVWNYATEKGRGEALWPLRYSLSGRDRSPDPFVIAAVLGKGETLARLMAAKSMLRSCET